MQHERTVKNRIMEIDTAKALGILCVFVGHRTHGFIHTYVYLFHMPLFLFLSGCLIKEEKLSWSNKIRKENRLLISYLVYSLIFVIFGLTIKQHGLKSLIINIGNTCTFYGIHTLWFLSSLWIAKMGVRFLSDIPRKSIRHGIAIAVYTVSFWISEALLKMTYPGLIGDLLKSVTWSLVRAGAIFIFVYLGFALQRQFISLINWLKDHMVITLFIAVASGLLLIPFTSFEAVDYHLLKNGIFILNVLYGGIGIVLVMCTAILITRYLGIMNKALTFIGKNSIHFMCSEYFSLMGYIVVLIEKAFGTLPYIEYISFAVYFPLLCLAIKFIGPFMDKAINCLVHKADSIAAGRHP